MPTSKSDLASRASMVTGLSCSAAASTSALSWRSSPLHTPGRRRAGPGGEPRHGVPPVGLILEQLEIVSLVLVHPDDPGHCGVIASARLGRGTLQQAKLSGGDLDTLADVLGEPADLADGIPVLLTLAAHLAERRAPGFAQGGIRPARKESGTNWGRGPARRCSGLLMTSTAGTPASAERRTL